MKKILLFLMMVITFFTQVNAKDNPYGISVNAGISNDIEIYRMGIQKPFNATLFEFESFTIEGFHELGFNYWIGERNNIHALSYSPVFKLLPTYYQYKKYQPYIDLGIGIALASDTKIDNRNLSSAFLFEDRISLGLTHDVWDFYFRYMHYSNAGLQTPNEGIDIYLLGFNYTF
ncbi:MAG: acyloxyacyl hydrolase [Arcobacteraceae bacterium]|jgi:lipid A 3-O-deacylase|nr:acyloxyacyl hydrolase [Arcobacteraceae bacterium]